MTVRFANVAVANAILDRLNEYDNRYKSFMADELMTPVYQNLYLKNNQSNRLKTRRLLQRLLAAGHITQTSFVRSEQGKLFSYQISDSAKTSGWDRRFPFNDAGGSPPDESPEPVEVPNVGVDDADLAEDADETPSPLPADNVELCNLKSRVQWLERQGKDYASEINELQKEMDAKENRLDQLEKMVASSAKTLKIEQWDGKIITLKNAILPSYFQTILDLAKMRENILMVGPAGCGKTTVAGLVAKTLGMKFGKIGGCGGLTETHLLGGKNQNLMKGTEKYRPSQFVIRFEQGGVMLIDELDGADQNVLLVLNPALDKSNELPLMNRIDNPIAKKHKDFVCIATANTFGTGNSRIYAGRNQLDASTLSRFGIGVIECGYDPNIEMALCPDEELRTRIQDIRKRAEECVIRRVIDTRFIESAYRMKVGAGWDNDKIIKQLFMGWTRDEQSKVMSA